MDHKPLNSDWSAANNCKIADDLVEYKRLAESTFNTVHRVCMDVAETEDEFIFRTLSDFARNNYQISVEKDELAKAIQLIRWSKEYGQSIDERWSTASRQAGALADAYRRGLEDGIEKERTRILDALSEKGE